MATNINTDTTLGYSEPITEEAGGSDVGNTETVTGQQQHNNSPQLRFQNLNAQSETSQPMAETSSNTTVDSERTDGTSSGEGRADQTRDNADSRNGAGRTTVRVTGNEVLPDNPGPYKWKCCSLKLWVIACIAGVFIPVLVITAATVSVVLTHEETRSFQTQHLTSGGTTEYGISRGTVDFYVYQRIYLEESSDDITLVIGMTVSTTNMNETIDSSLASGPSINEEYCNSNFTYTATVTGNITSNVIFVVRRTDEQNKVTTVCNETITSSGKLLNCVSNDSGYYDASFNNPENVIGNVIGTVSCGIIDTKAYENESSKCTAADSGGSGCSVAVTQTHNQVILFLPSDIDSRMVTLRYKLRLWVFITSSVIFGLIVSILVAFVLIPLIHWTCRRRLSSSTSEVGDEREEQRERNSQPVGSPQEEVEV